MGSKKPLEIDMIAGSQLRDTQGEMLSVEGADITDLIAGNGRLNDNHGKGFWNSIGRITDAKKIFKSEDCENDREKYYWDKVKAPFIYVKGILYDDDEHPNAKAAAAILRNIHKTDTPLKLKASVEGGVVARGIGDDRLLARTKIHSVALTFTPANNATLVEPTSMEKSDTSAQDMLLIKSVMHLAKTDVPSFRHITRRAQAEKISENLRKANELAEQAGLKTIVPNFTADELISQALEYKITQNINKINELVKSMKSGEEKIKAHLPIMVHPTKSYKLDSSKDSPTIHPVDPDDDPMHEHTHAPTHHNYAKEYSKDYKPEVGIAHEALAHHYDGSKKLDAKELANHKATLKTHYYKGVKKALTAGYGGAGNPTSRTGGSVLQAEHLDDGRKGFNYITCDNCGHEQVYMKHQVKCRGKDCGSNFPMQKLYKLMINE